MSNGFKIQLREYVTLRPRGDRDMTAGSDCSDYKVVLINGEGKETNVGTFDGFDNFWTIHHDPDQVRAAAMKTLTKKAAFFGATILPAAKFRPTPPRPAKSKWTKVNA
jgi:hypothetical protein